MPSISRSTLNEEFYDKTTDMLLVQPEPKYLFAELFLGAFATDLQIDERIGLQFDNRPVGGVNGSYASWDRDQLVLSMNLPREIIAGKWDFKGESGNTIRINRPKYANTTYTESSRRVVTGNPISLVPINAGSEQTSLTLYRYAGPYDQTNSRPAPFALESFDAAMGVHNLATFVGTQLKRDFHRFVDFQYANFGEVSGVGKIYPDGFTGGLDGSVVNGAATGAGSALVGTSFDNNATLPGSFPMTAEMVSRTGQVMDELNLPSLPDGRRVLILTPAQWKQLEHDPEWELMSKFHEEFNFLFKTYVGSTPRFHVFFSNTLPIVANSSLVNVHHGLAIAPGAWLAGMSERPLVRPAADDNYGLTPKVIWESMMAFGIGDSRFFLSVRSA